MAIADEAFSLVAINDDTIGVQVVDALAFAACCQTFVKVHRQSATTVLLPQAIGTFLIVGNQIIIFGSVWKEVVSEYG